MAYILQLLLICGFGMFFLFDGDKEKINVISFLLFSFGVCFFMMGLRDITVGVDTHTYSYWFNMIKKYDLRDVIVGKGTNNFELGWRLLNKITSIFSKDYYFFQMIHAFFYCALSAIFFYKNSNHIFVTMIIFLGMGIYTSAFNMQRQSLAVMFVVNGYTYLKEKKYVSSYCLFFISILFHTSAIIFVLYILLYYWFKSEKCIKIIPILIIVSSIIYQRLIEIISKFFPMYSKYYSNTRTADLIKAGGIWFIWIMILLFSFYIVYLKKECEDNKIKLYSIFSSLYVTFNIIGTNFNIIGRLGAYFLPFVPLMFDYFGENFSGSKRKLYYIFITIAFAALYIQRGFHEKNMEYTIFF